MAYRKHARHISAGEFVRVGENVNIDYVDSVGFDDGEGTRDPRITLMLQPIDGSPEYLATLLPHEVVEVGWTVAVGLPVWLEADERGNIVASVDWDELEKAVSEQVDNDRIVRTVGSWIDNHEVLPVAFPKPDRPSERCPKCGSPVAVWYEGLPDGDAEPRSQCLVTGCYGSTV